MRVLIACEESQRVCISFRELGHEAYSCDVKPCSGGHPEWHIQGDVLPLLNQHWDIIIAHPPCTYLSVASACRLYHSGQIDMERYYRGLAAKDFFLEFLNCGCPRVCVENPVSLRIFDMPRHTQTIEPYMFGDPYRKKTRLWLRGLPELKPTCIVDPLGSYVPSHTSAKSSNSKGLAKRGNDSCERSKTFWGIARAMAAQWGTFT